MFMTASIDIVFCQSTSTLKRNITVHSVKSEAEVTYNKRLGLRYCTVEANVRRMHSCGISARAELLVSEPSTAF